MNVTAIMDIYKTVLIILLGHDRFSSTLTRDIVFTTKNNLSIQISSSTRDITHSFSLNECAVKCATDQDCCSASFYGSSCFLDSSCSPQTVSSVDSKLLLKNKTKEYDRSENENWIMFNMKYYLFVNDRKLFDDAQADCLKRNGYLAEPKTWDEIVFIANGTRQTGYTHWLGGSDREEEGVWIWVTSREKITIDDWMAGQPNDFADQDCLTVAVDHAADFEWNDDFCTEVYRRYVCERP